MPNAYTNLVTSQYASKPKFLESIQVVTDSFINNQTVAGSMSSLFDLDTAVGAQLDVLGQWIGMSRVVQIPISGLYFSFDIVGVGFDEGIWFQTGNLLFTSQVISDDLYRKALQAKSLANRIGRSLYDVYLVLDVFFRGTPTSAVVHDYGDMSMAFEITSAVPDDATLAILNNDYLQLRPEGVSLLPTILL